MKLFFKLGLVSVVLWQACVVVAGQVGAERTRVLSWNESAVGELFCPLSGPDRIGLEGHFVYDDGGFLFLLTKSLYYDRASDYFVTWVGQGPRQGLLMLTFRCGGCRGKGLYRTANGPEVTLNDL